MYDRLIDARGGDEKDMVFLGIGGAEKCEHERLGKIKKATRLKAVTQLFIDQGHGVFWDLCQGDLEEGLLEALMPVVDQSCKEFNPPHPDNR